MATVSPSARSALARPTTTTLRRSSSTTLPSGTCRSSPSTPSLPLRWSRPSGSRLGSRRRPGFCRVRLPGTPCPRHWRVLCPFSHGQRRPRGGCTTVHWTWPGQDGLLAAAAWLFSLNGCCRGSATGRRPFEPSEGSSGGGVGRVSTQRGQVFRPKSLALPRRWSTPSSHGRVSHGWPGRHPRSSTAASRRTRDSPSRSAGRQRGGLPRVAPGGHHRGGLPRVAPPERHRGGLPRVAPGGLIEVDISVSRLKDALEVDLACRAWRPSSRWTSACRASRTSSRWTSACRAWRPSTRWTSACRTSRTF